MVPGLSLPENPCYRDVLVKEKEVVAVVVALPDLLESWGALHVSVNHTAAKAAMGHGEPTVPK